MTLFYHNYQCFSRTVSLKFWVHFYQSLQTMILVHTLRMRSRRFHWISFITSSLSIIIVGKMDFMLNFIGVSMSIKCKKLNCISKFNIVVCFYKRYCLIMSKTLSQLNKSCKGYSILVHSTSHKSITCKCQLIQVLWVNLIEPKSHFPFERTCHLAWPLINVVLSEIWVLPWKINYIFGIGLHQI